MEDIENQKIAQKLWDTPFAVCRIEELEKSELVVLVREMLNRIMLKYENWNDMEIKDMLFEEKCWLIKALDPEFFDRKRKNNDNVCHKCGEELFNNGMLEENDMFDDDYYNNMDNALHMVLTKFMTIWSDFVMNNVRRNMFKEVMELLVKIE